MKSWALIYLILQIIATFFLFLALVVGSIGIGYTRAFGVFEGSSAIYPLEVVFTLTTCLLLLAAIAFIIVEVIMDVMDKPLSKRLNAGFCLLAGILMVIAAMLVITAGALMMSSGGRVVRHAGFGYWSYYDYAGYASDYYSSHKIAGGVMAIISAILYFVAAVLIFKYYGAGGEMCHG